MHLSRAEIHIAFLVESDVIFDVLVSKEFATWSNVCNSMATTQPADVYELSEVNLRLDVHIYSDLRVPAIDEEFVPGPRSRHLIVEAAFLAQHGVFRRLNPGAESRPTPPNEEHGEHNG